MNEGLAPTGGLFAKEFSCWAGPRAEPKILLLGEALHQGELEVRKPFVGSPGKELWSMLGEVFPDVQPELHAEATSLQRYGPAWARKREEWLAAAGIAMTSVFNFVPAGGKLEALCGSKKEMSKGYDYPAIAHGKYLHERYLPDLFRVHGEIISARPTLVVAAGSTACWAMLRATNIGSIRGTVSEAARLASSAGAGTGSGVAGRDEGDAGAKAPWPTGKGLKPAGLKVLPTFHPAAVLYSWANRPIMVMDLMKAKRESAFAEIRRPARQVLINPSLEEIREWINQTLEQAPRVLSVDIETAAGQITCIGFGRSRMSAMVVPFWNPASPQGSYWPSPAAELEAWRLVELLLQSKIPKLFQNGMYDLQYITKMGLKVSACLEDSMLLHHSLFPEMKKGLGFLGSVYTNEPAWKLMRVEKADTEKKDE